MGGGGAGNDRFQGRCMSEQCNDKHGIENVILDSIIGFTNRIQRNMKVFCVLELICSM